MQKFYTKVLIVVVALTIATIASLYFAYRSSLLQETLFPITGNSALPWEMKAVSDRSDGGDSTVAVTQNDASITVNFELKEKIIYPYSAILMSFADHRDGSPLVDLSDFHTINFDLMCTPHNILRFMLYSFDESLTQPTEFATYRPSNFYFSCDQTLQRVSIDLNKLIAPDWWLNKYQLNYSSQYYNRKKVLSIGIYSSWQSPVNTASSFQLSNAELVGQSMRNVYIVGFALILSWLMAAFLLVRQHTQWVLERLRIKLQQDKPLAAYQVLPSDNKSENQKTALLYFMATEYADAELSVEAVSTALGINRVQINDILKEEVSLTFTAYLNKIRLTESARLLLASDIGIAEVAYKVGYSNPSYFNKLFKNEYGCTPKVFRQHIERSDPS